MPSFDVVSEVDLQEVKNAVDQASREVGTRFDFKDTGSEIELGESAITLRSATEDRLRALRQVLEERLLFLELAGEDLPRQVQDLEDPRIPDPVVHARPVLPAAQHAGLAQQVELLRGAAGLRLHRSPQIAHRALTTAQQLDEPDPRRMPEQPEDLGLELPERPAHAAHTGAGCGPFSPMLRR